MANTAEQMESMLPSTDTDYYNTPERDFTASDFASDTWEQARKRFMDAGITNTNPDDPKLVTAYNKSIDYLKDVGLSGLLATQAAYEFAVGSVADSVPFASESTKKSLARDLAAMPEAFVGGGTRSLSQLDDIAELAAPAAKQTIAKTVDLADRVYVDPNKAPSILGSFSLRSPREEGNFKKARDLFRKEGGLDPKNFKGVNKKVYNQTGWYIDPADNQWRYQISDKNAKLNLGNFKVQIKNVPIGSSKAVSLSDILKHNELFKRYPHLKNVRIRFVNAPGNNIEKTSLGSYAPGQNLIEINTAKIDVSDTSGRGQFKSTLFHEIQHAIQEYEGFVPGASSDNIPFKLTEKHASTLTSALTENRERRESLLEELDYASLGLGYNTSPIFKLVARDKNLKPGFVAFQSEESVIDEFNNAVQKSGLPANIFDLPPGSDATLMNLERSLNGLRNGFLIDVRIKERLRDINSLLYRGAGGELESGVVETGLLLGPTELKYRNYPLKTKDRIVKSNEGELEGFAGSLDEFAAKSLGPSEPGFERKRRSRIPVPGVTDARIDINFDGVYNPLDLTSKGFAEMSATERSAAYTKFLLDNIIKDNKELKKIKNLKRGDTFSFTLKNGNTAKAKFKNVLLRRLDRQDVEKGEGQIILKDIDPNTYEDARSFKVPEVELELLIDDAGKTFTTTYKATLPELIKNSDLVKDGKNFDVMDLQEKLPEEGVFSKIKNKLGFAEGGDTVRPETKPEAEVDVSPRAEAGDQFFVEQAEREKAFKTKPKPRPSMDKSFPDVKPKARPKRVEKSGVYTEEYDLKGVSVEIPVIVFKDGERIAFDKALQTIAERGTANEPVVGMSTEKQIRKFLDENNPTREEFETYWYNKRLNKGGMIGDQMQMAFMNEGGLTDDGMDVDPVSGNDIPSGSMAEEVRDDIPAQLSDGEYVVPADVVRYYGVKFFEDLRDQAKMGLAEMEANGRIGGEPVPAGGPINNKELSPEEMQAIQEMMGMSQGGAIGKLNQQQQILQEPSNKAVGNSQMMYGGGQVRGYQDSSLVTGSQVESSMLGGQSPAQVEQQMLSAGSAARAENYIGSPLGFSIFGDSSTGVQNPNQQGVQQTEAKAFAPITLYNTAGQTKTVNSAAEEKSARAAGFNMTLDQYNMYRSQRGGSGGSGGGSGIITPPGQEDKESKPWGEGVDWNNQDSIRKFVKEAQEGNIEGASGRFLRGAGFALLGLPGAMLVGAFQTFQGKQTLADMQTAQEIARANGFDDLATEIQGDINTYLKTAGDAINFVNDVFGPSTSQADRWARTQGFDTLEDYAAAQEDMRAKAEIVKKKTPSFKGLKSTTKKADKPYIKVDKDGKTISKTSSTKPGATPSVTPKGDLDVAKEQEKYEGGPGFRNKGGLMTKNKKAKK